MADIFLRSTDGSDADNGTTWALAKASIDSTDGAAFAAAAGDRIFVSDNHAEANVGSLTVTLAGTLASPNQVICVDDAGDPAPPTAVATTGVIECTGTSGLIINGSAYCYGLTLKGAAGSGSTSSIGLAQADNNHQRWENSAFYMAGTSANSRLAIGSSSSGVESSVELINCTARFSHASQGLSTTQCKLRWSGGGLHASTTAITDFIATANDDGMDVICEGLDLSAGATGMNLIATGQRAPGRAIFRNCKLPASWSGSLLGGAPANMAFRAEMYNCDAGDTNYKLWIEDYAGSIRDETTHVRSGGASDGTTARSLKMVSSANAEYPAIPLEGPERAIWNETVDSAITLTWEFEHAAQGSGAGGDLTNAEFGFVVQYLGTSGVPLSVFTNTFKANVLAAAADYANSLVTWNGGLGSAVKQKATVTFTPREKGVILWKPVLYKASSTVYVDDKVTVS